MESMEELREGDLPLHRRTRNWCRILRHYRKVTHCGGYTLVTLPRTVTPYRDCVDGTRDHVTYQVYAVTLRVCSVHCRYLAVASKGWHVYGLSRSGRVMWHVTAVRSSRLLYVHDASGSRNKLGTPWCNARRILLRNEARDESSDRIVSVTCNVTALRYAVTLQVCTHL
jgi:hypothetical protein